MRRFKSAGWLWLFIKIFSECYDNTNMIYVLVLVRQRVDRAIVAHLIRIFLSIHVCRLLWSQKHCHCATMHVKYLIVSQNTSQIVVITKHFVLIYQLLCDIKGCRCRKPKFRYSKTFNIRREPLLAFSCR